jgi:hypothetical protein
MDEAIDPAHLHLSLLCHHLTSFYPEPSSFLFTATGGAAVNINSNHHHYHWLSQKINGSRLVNRSSTQLKQHNFIKPLVT